MTFILLILIWAMVGLSAFAVVAGIAAVLFFIGSIVCDLLGW